MYTPYDTVMINRLMASPVLAKTVKTNKQFMFTIITNMMDFNWCVNKKICLPVAKILTVVPKIENIEICIVHIISTVIIIDWLFITNMCADNIISLWKIKTTLLYQPIYIPTYHLAETVNLKMTLTVSLKHLK